MKILFATDFYYPNVSGVSVFVHRLTQLLQHQGHEIIVIAPAPTRFSGWYVREALPVYGVRSLPLPFYHWLRVTFPLLIEDSLQRVIMDFKPDVIHVQGHFIIGKTVQKIGKRLGVPVMGTNHFVPENLSHYFPKVFRHMVSRWLAKGTCNVFEKYSRVTTPTQTAANIFRDMGFTKPVDVISNGVDQKRFRAELSDFLQRRYNLEGRSVLLYVGRLDGEKNLDIVLKSLKLLPSKTSISFVIVGQGMKRGHLERLVREYDIGDRVIFTGFVSDEDLVRVYQSADCFIMPSTAELQSLATMEAMASGLPVIAVNAMALPELVHPGKNGFLFERENENELAVVIEKLMSDEALRKKMGKESLRIIEAHDLDAMGREYEKIYQSLTSTG